MEARAKIFGHAIHPILIVYPLGLLSAAVIFDIIYLATGNPTWTTVSFWMIAAAIIGGTALSGGRGSVPGAILGALLIAVIRNGLVLLEFSAYWGTLVTGVVIIVAVAIGGLVKSR